MKISDHQLRLNIIQAWSSWIKEITKDGIEAKFGTHRM